MRSSLVLLLGIALVLAFGGEQRARAQTKRSAAPDRPPRTTPSEPKPQRLIFDDDEIDCDLPRPDDVLVTGANRPRMISLIRVRTTLIPELMKTAEGL